MQPRSGDEANASLQDKIRNGPVARRRSGQTPQEQSLKIRMSFLSAKEIVPCNVTATCRIWWGKRKDPNHHCG